MGTVEASLDIILGTRMMSDSTDFYEIDCQGIDSTSPTGRINTSKPKIVIIDSGCGMSAALATQFAKDYSLVDVDYSDLERRIISHTIREPKDDIMDQMEEIYRYQDATEKDYQRRKERYFEEFQKHGLGRKNPRWGSRVAKDHRSATKRQRSARKKNRKK